MLTGCQPPAVREGRASQVLCLLCVQPPVFSTLPWAALYYPPDQDQQSLTLHQCSHHPLLGTHPASFLLVTAHTVCHHQQKGSLVLVAFSVGV